MVDEMHRWCLQCDLEARPLHTRGPRPQLDDYVDDLIARSRRGEAKRIFENQSRVTRLADARRIALPNGEAALAFVITLGNRRGANPGFIHFDDGNARDADRRPGEVKGASAHGILRLVEDNGHVGRFRLMVEEVRGIGRSPITRLLGNELKEIADARGENFVDPASGRRLKHRPVIEVHPRQSRAIAAAINGVTSLPVTLIDTSAIPAFDEHPDYRVRQHELRITVRPREGRSMQQALQALAQLGQAQDYDRMRVSWTPPGTGRAFGTEMATDLADVGTALFAERAEVILTQPLSECRDRLSDEFIDLMACEF